MSYLSVKVLIFLEQQHSLPSLIVQLIQEDQIQLVLPINNRLTHYQRLMEILLTELMDRMMEFYSAIVAKDFGILLQIVDIYRDVLGVENPTMLSFVQDRGVIPDAVIVQVIIMQVFIFSPRKI